jgi:WD40 repeat protein
MNIKQIFKPTHCLLLIFVAAQLSTAQPPELLVQMGHTFTVNSVAFSSDGRTLASGGQGRDVLLWDAVAGTEVRTLKAHQKDITAVAFSPDGKLLASGSNDETVKLWDAHTGRVLKTYRRLVRSLVFSANGAVLAGVSQKPGKVWLWALGSNKEDEFDATSIAFSIDGRMIALGHVNTIELIDFGATAKSESTTKNLDGSFSMVFSLVFSPDGKTLASGTVGKNVKLWDVATGTLRQTLESHPAQLDDLNLNECVVFSPDGTKLASVSKDQSVKVWDPATGHELFTLKGPAGDMTSLAFSPDGRTLVSGNWYGTVTLWDVINGKELKTLGGRVATPRSLEFSEDGRTLASANYTQGARLWSLTGNTATRTFKSDSTTGLSVGFRPGGRLVVDGSELWNIGTGERLTARASKNATIPNALSLDGRLLALLDPSSTIRVLEISSGNELWKRQMERSLDGLAFSPDGKMLAGWRWSDPLILWDAETGRELRQLQHFDATTAEKLARPVFDIDLLEAVAFRADSRLLATGGSDKTVKIWDAGTGRRLLTLAGHSESIGALAFSRDGQRLASGSVDGTILLWDVVTGKKEGLLKGHSDTVYAVAFSPDGHTLASGSADGTIKIWDVATAKQLASLVAIGTSDWLIVTPDGLLDASSGAWHEALWRFSQELYDVAPVESFFNEFFYPGLLTDIFAGKRPKAPSDISQKDRRQPQLKLMAADAPPDAQLTARNLTVKINALEAAADREHNTGSGAQDVRLFRNGSLVKVWRGDVLKGQSSVTLEATIPIVAGANNFTAYTFNHDNIKSEDASFTVTGADSLKRKGTLNILAVGVSQYANQEYNLNYTTDDATSFASQLKLEQEKQSRYQSVEIKTLLNQNATKENILAELRKLAASVQPEDAVVVYFSGHGKASGDHFYLVPHDLGYNGSRDQLSAEGLKLILAHSISDLELEEVFRGIDAGQMFMIIDACNSGQALENKDEPRRGPMNTRGLAQLAYEKGMYIMTASQNVEEAFVSEKLKHSYLTFALVEEGLKTKAADADRDGEVTLREWFDYALARVPKLREEVLQTKSLEEVTPKLKAARSQKSQTPRVFYRREVDSNPLVVAVFATTAPQ